MGPSGSLQAQLSGWPEAALVQSWHSIVGEASKGRCLGYLQVCCGAAFRHRESQVELLM